MKYSKTALGLLNAQYRSVLRKCFLINAGLFALGAIATPANADSTVTTATELVDAVKAADTAGNTTTTITLGNAISDGDGLFLTQNKNNDITLNLNSKSLNIDGPAVGSTGTENQGIHAEKNNKLTIEDGNISFNGSSDIKMGIQNYSDLTLDKVNIDGNGVSGKYVLSNNNGTTTIKNSTITAKVGGVAFDVCDATGVGYSGTTVNLIDSTIQGAIELANWGTPVGQSTENAVLNASGDNKVTGNINNELGSVNLTDGTLTLDGSITGNGELNIDSGATLAMTGDDAVISQKSVENNGKISVLEGKTTLKSTVTGTGTMSAANGATLDTSQASIEQSEIDLKGATVQNNMFSAIGNLKADTYDVDAATTTNLTALGTDGEYKVLSANGAKDVVLGDTGTKVYLGTNAEGNEIATQKYVADNAVQSVVTGETNGTIKVDGTEVAVAGLGSAAYTSADAYDVKGAAAAVQGNTTKTVADNEAEIARVNGELVNTNAALNQTNTNLSNLNGAVEAEIARAKAAEQANANAISAEETRAKAAEQANANAITAEETRAKAAEQANANAITAEETRAKAAEQANANAITAEETRAKAAEQANANAISAETQRATAAEQAIDAKFTNGTVEAKFASVETTGDVTVGRNLNIKGNLDIEGAIEVDGDVKVGDKFSVTASDGSFSAADGAFTVNKNGRISVNNNGEEVFFVNKNGKLSAAGGDFVVDQNGNVETAGTLSVADGAFDVDEDGAIYAANGAFEVNKNGRISVYGDDGEEVFFVNKNGKLSAAGGDFVVDPNGNINKVGDITSSGKVTAANGFEVDANNSLTADGLVAATADIAGDANVGGALTVAGLSKLDGGIDVNNGMFVVDAADGSFTAANGNFEINENGSIAAAGNKFVVNKDGNITKAGTISAADGTFLVKEGGAVSAAAGTFLVKEGGEVSAAAGKFEINEGGRVSAAGGNFIIETDGSFGLDNEKFAVDAEGNLVAASIETDGDATIGGDLTVAGDTTLADTTVDGDLTVTGLSKLDGGINVNNGMFVVDAADGSFTAANGNFEINENGSIAAANNQFVVNKDGNITKAGTISAADGTFLVKEGGAVSAAAGTFLVKEGGLVTAAAGNYQIKEGGTVSAAAGKFEVKEGGAVSAAAGKFTVDADGNTATKGTMTADGESKFVKDGDKYVLDVTSDAVTANKVIEAKEGVKFGTDTIAMTSVTRDAIASKPAEGSDAVIASATAVQKTRAAIEADNAAVLGGIYKIDDTEKTVSYDATQLIGDGFSAAATGTTANLTQSLKDYAANVETATGGTFADDGVWTGSIDGKVDDGTGSLVDRAVAYGTITDNNILDVVDRLYANVGNTAVTGTNDNILNTNTVNQNLDRIDSKIGDIRTLNGNALNKGTTTQPTTVVAALQNINDSIGKVHGLYDGSTVNSTTVASTVNGNSNLMAVAGGVSTAEDHLVSLDNAIGDRTLASKNTAINDAMSGESVAAGIKAAGDAIGDMNFGQSHYVSAQNDLSGAVRTLDSNLYRVETDLHDLKRDFNRGMASMAAMSALVPNPRAHGNTSLAIGTGAYSGHTAAAIGGFHYLTDNIMLNAGVAWGNSRDASYRMGVTFSW